MNCRQSNLIKFQIRKVIISSPYLPPLPLNTSSSHHSATPAHLPRSCAGLTKIRLQHQHLKKLLHRCLQICVFGIIPEHSQHVFDQRMGAVDFHDPFGWWCVFIHHLHDPGHQRRHAAFGCEYCKCRFFLT